LRHSGNAQAANFSSFHQALNRTQWSPLALSRQLLLMIVETFVPASASVDLVIDETLERRWGSKISKRDHYRDSALSPDGYIPVAQAAWYRKPTATFGDVLATIRRSLWRQETFPTSPTDPDVVLVPRSTLERWSLALC